MPTIDDLSNEVLSQIFECLRSIHGHQRNLCSCLLVSRHWYHLALPIVWKTLHLNFNWKAMYDLRKQQGQKNGNGLYPAPGPGVYLVAPLHLDQFSRCLELHEMKSLDPLQWCRFLSLEIEDSVLDIGVASTAELVSIILRCNNIHGADIFLQLHDEKTLSAFRLIWGLISRHLSKQRRLNVRLILAIKDLKLSLYDDFVGRIRKNITDLAIFPCRSRTECFGQGVLSKLESLKSLTLRTCDGSIYSPIQNQVFWDEVGILPLDKLRIMSPSPALKWDGEIAPLATSLRILHLEFNERKLVLQNPMDFISRFPNLEALSLGLAVGRPSNADDRDDDAEINRLDGSPNCLLCQQQLTMAYPLRTLELSVACITEGFRAAILASPLLYSIKFPPRSTNDDILFVVSSCAALEDVGFAKADQPFINSYGLIFLCKAKQLDTISVDGLQWHHVEGILEHWATQLPCLERITLDGDAKEFILKDTERWESVKLDSFVAGYGSSQFCCLEEEAKDLVLQDNTKLSPENSVNLKTWLCSYWKEEDYSGYLDVVAMQEALMSDRI